MRTRRALCGVHRSRAISVHKQGVDKGVNEGRRGVHGVPTAAQIWGISPEEYLEKADAWPLNPNGELLLGLKLEDKYALANADEILKIPGIAFAEWGPGDMALSLGVRGPARPQCAIPRCRRRGPRSSPRAKQQKFFLNTVEPNDVIDMIKEGVMIGPASKEAAEIGREVHEAEMPW